jgi:hypothetical protein
MQDAALKSGSLVWFRLGRMHGYPPQTPVRAMVTKVRDNGFVDLEIGCEDMSVVSGSASMVAPRDSLPPALQEQQACYWIVRTVDQSAPTKGTP